MRSSRVFVPFVALVCGVALAACSSDNSFELTLSADADGGEATVTYDIGDGPVSKTVATPWELPVEVDGQFSVSLQVDNPEDTGVVRCAIDLGGPGSPSATGEAGATCDLSGRASGSELTTSSSALGEDRAGPEILDEATGLTFELRTVRPDGTPAVEPALFEPLVFEVVVGPITEPGQLRVEYELIDPETRRTSNDIFRYELDDLDDDANLVYEIPGRGGFVPLVDGSHTVDVTGTLFLESGPEFVFDDRVEIDFGSVEVTTATQAQVAGAIALDVPSDWRLIRSSDALLVTTENGPLEPDQLTGSSLEEILSYEHAAGSGSVAVFQLLAPLALPADATIADELVGVAGLTADQITRGSATIDGRPTERIDGVTDDQRLELDVVSIGAERFVVQVRADRDDEESWAAAMAVRDSIAFDDTAIPPLLHRVTLFSSAGPSGAPLAQTTIVIPADWQLIDSDQGILEDPTGSRSLAIATTIADGQTIDDLIAGSAGALGLDAEAFDRTRQMEGFDDTAIAPADSDADGVVDTIVLVATFGDAAVSVELADRSAEPDLALLDAIIDTLAVES